MNNVQWPSEQTVLKKPVGVYELDVITVLSAQVASLTRQL